MSQTLDYLKEHGPSTTAEIPAYPTPKERMAGVWRFKVPGRSNTGTPDPMGTITPVFYVRGEAGHDRETVIRTFLEANPVFVEKKTLNGAVQELNNHGRSWRPAVKSVCEEVFDE